MPVVVAVIFTPPGMLPLSVAPVDLCRTSGSMRVTFAIYCVLTFARPSTHVLFIVFVV